MMVLALRSGAWLPVVDHDAQIDFAGLGSLACEIDAARISLSACCLLPVGVAQLPAILRGDDAAFTMRDKGVAIGIHGKALQPALQTCNRKWPAQTLCNQRIYIASGAWCFAGFRQGGDAWCNGNGGDDLSEWRTQCERAVLIILL